MRLLLDSCDWFQSYFIRRSNKRTLSDNSFKNAIKENKRLLRENEDLNQKLKLKKQQDLTDKIKARRIIAQDNKKLKESIETKKRELKSKSKYSMYIE